MPNKALLFTPQLTHEKSLKTLVENRTIFSLNHCELNIFETYQESELVPLKFNDLVVTSMLRGKKVMHLFEDPSFDYLPGETVIVPQNTEMKIDFPEASKDNPTQCIALAIDNKIITDTLDFLNEKYPKEGKNNPMVPVLEYIRANIRESINLRELSDKACMSPTSFYRYFKRELGMSPIEFILSEKIKQAKQLLKDPNVQINEVSYASGFEDSNYFIRIFKKYEGVTPKQYQLMNLIN